MVFINKFKKGYYTFISFVQNFKYKSIILALWAFTESIFFPLPPDIFLIALGLAVLSEKKYKALFYYAFITTVFSTLGGIVGYLLGFYLYDTIIYNLLVKFNYINAFNVFKDIYNQYQSLAIFVAGFSPFPYKIATITSGVLKSNIVLFILFSFISRGIRFFLLALVLYFIAKKGKSFNKKFFTNLVWIITILIIIFFSLYYFVKY